MLSAVDVHATNCPRCSGALDYRLGVNEGGGLRYDVTCPPCGVVLYALSAVPIDHLPLAA
jgi:hypothetical protein